MSTTTDKNNILTVTRRPVKAAAVQFTGKNGAEIVAFIKEYYGDGNPGFGVRNGGSYVSVNTSIGGSFRVRKGDWVVVDANGGLVAPLTPEDFAILFNIKK